MHHLILNEISQKINLNRRPSFSSLLRYRGPGSGQPCPSAPSLHFCSSRDSHNSPKLLCYLTQVSPLFPLSDMPSHLTLLENTMPLTIALNVFLLRIFPWFSQAVIPSYLLPQGFVPVSCYNVLCMALSPVPLLCLVD